MKKIATVGSTDYFLRADGIIYTASSSPSPLTVDIMIANFEFIKQLAIDKGEAIRMLTDFDAAQNVDREARAYIKSSASNAYDDYIIGSALICQSAVSRMLGNFILGLRGSGQTAKQQVKLFQSKEKAIAWLLELPPKPLNLPEDEVNRTE